MSDLTRFPFKSMLPIIDYLHSNDSNSPLEVYDIQSASNACYPDTSEVLEMLSFLTLFGQVKKNQDNWIIINKGELPSKKQFRERYLLDIVKILNSLDDQGQNLENLAQSIPEIDMNSLLNHLEFLETISAHGIVTKTANGWILKKHDFVEAVFT